MAKQRGTSSKIKRGAKTQPAPAAPKAKPAQKKIAKPKHQRAQAGHKHPLLPKLEADSAKRTGVSPAALKRQRRAANSNVLGAVSGLKISLEELLAEGEKRVPARQRQVAVGGAQAGSSAGLSNKKRMKLVAEETRHLRDVIEHPAFVADPIAALREHLKNTVAPRAPRGRW